MFRKSKILKICPISFELRVIPTKDYFQLTWGESQQSICDIFAPEALIKLIIESCNDYSRYQEEPFSKLSSHHNWIWFYEEFIPPFMQSPCCGFLRRRSLLFDHYGKEIMEAYINEELRQKEEEFMEKFKIRLEILTWNAAGLTPCGEIEDWLGCKSRRFSDCPSCPDILVIGLQEMCGLSKILGDSIREAEWAAFLKEQVQKTFRTSFVTVRNK
jgi:hypothetical protein